MCKCTWLVKTVSCGLMMSLYTYISEGMLECATPVVSLVYLELPMWVCFHWLVFFGILCWFHFSLFFFSVRFSYVRAEATSCSKYTKNLAVTSRKLVFL